MTKRNSVTRKSCALIGPGKGPAVRVAGELARIHVRGLHEGEFALVAQRLNEDEGVVLPVHEDGIYNLVECSYASVSYEGANRDFIACILIGG